MAEGITVGFRDILVRSARLLTAAASNLDELLRRLDEVTAPSAEPWDRRDSELARDAAELVQFVYQWQEADHGSRITLSSGKRWTVLQEITTPLAFLRRPEPLLGLALRRGDTVVLAFRGTVTPSEWGVNLNNVLAGAFGSQLRSYQWWSIFLLNKLSSSMKIARKAVKSPLKEVVLVGHSLGGALAVDIAVVSPGWLPDGIACRVISFGAPPTGHNLQALKIKYTRFILPGDIIPSNPLSCELWEHSAPGILLTSCGEGVVLIDDCSDLAFTLLLKCLLPIYQEEKCPLLPLRIIAYSLVHGGDAVGDRRARRELLVGSVSHLGSKTIARLHGIDRYVEQLRAR